ncbi:putative membrane protein [Anaplasma phagocytophilum str. CR1007]|nr:putative membrane protein [Anaplasma phagocytophilum str. CR1007]
MWYHGKFVVSFYSGYALPYLVIFQFTQFWCPDRDISVLWE